MVKSVRCKSVRSELKSMKSVLFLGGGQLGLPSIKWAKEIGFNVIVNDKSENAPGLELADECLNFDSTDIRGLTIWAVQNNDKYNIQYCYCGSDFGLLTVANIHNALGIKYPSIKAIINGLDKRLMKRSWSNTKIKYPKSILINSFNEIDEVLKKIPLPIVMKPTDSSGSQGVVIVSKKDDLRFAFEEAIKFSTDNVILVEEYIEGSHHDVNGLFWNGEFFPCGIGDRYFTKGRYPVPHHGYFPTSLPKQKTDQLYNLVEHGARAMGIDHGPVKGDCIIRNGECFVYEISPRFHGDIFTANTLGFLNKTNPIYQLMKMIYDEEPYEFKDITSDNKIAGWKTLFYSSNEFNESDVGGIYRIEKNDVRNHYDIIKNNAEIAGLIWVSKKNRREIDECLRIHSNYEE